MRGNVILKSCQNLLDCNALFRHWFFEEPFQIGRSRSGSYRPRVEGGDITGDNFCDCLSESGMLVNKIFDHSSPPCLRVLLSQESHAPAHGTKSATVQNHTELY